MLKLSGKILIYISGNKNNFKINLFSLILKNII